MSRSGPTPVPSAVKRLRGTWRPDREGNAPEPTVAVPEPPDFLDAIALEEWHRLTSHLLKLGLLSELDRGTLALCCLAWSRCVVLSGEVASLESLFIEVGENGYRQAAPEVSALRQAQTDYVKLSEQFGLSPAARSRISVELPPEVGGNRFAKHGRRMGVV